MITLYLNAQLTALSTQRTLCYADFEISTYFPVTKQSIRRAKVQVDEKTWRRVIERLRARSKRPYRLAGSFDGNNVRLLAIDGARNWYVDQAGHIESSGVRGSLSPEDVFRLNLLLWEKAKPRYYDVPRPIRAKPMRSRN